MDEELAQIFSAQTVCMYAIIEWIISSQDHNRAHLIDRLYELQADAYTSKAPAAAGAMSHIINLLEQMQDKKR